MRFRNILVFLGFVTLFVQFLGFPQSWDDMFYVAIGLLVMAFSYLAGKERKQAREEVAPASATPLEAKS